MGVRRAEIPLTQKLHDEFWSELRKFSPVEQADFLRMTSVAALLAHEYHVEGWECALLSFRKQKIFKSRKIISLEGEMRSKLLATLPPTLSENTKRAATKEFDGKFQNALLNINRLLEAAANHQPLELPGRGAVALSEAYIQATITSLKDTLDKMQRLVNPVWTELIVNDGRADRSQAIRP